MDITKKDLLEMNITDIHENCESHTKFRSCRILYDFIEGDLNKRLVVKNTSKKHWKLSIVVTIEKKPRLDLKRDMVSQE